MNIGWILLLMAGNVIVILYILLAIFYRCGIRNEQTMTLRQAFHISSVSPEKWEVYDGIGCYLIYKSDNGEEYIIYMKSYFDRLRLGAFYRHQKRKKIDSIQAKERAKLIKEWQKDINHYQDKYMEHVKTYYKKGMSL